MTDYAVYVTQEVVTKYLVDADSIEEAVRRFREGEFQWTSADEDTDDLIMEIHVEVQDEDNVEFEQDFDQEAYFAVLNASS